MKNFNHKLSYLALIAALGLGGCGPTEEDIAELNAALNDDEQASDTSSASDSTITGVITGFGSVFVDGVEFETDSSSFSVDGVSATEDDLAIGMVVTLQGTVNQDGSTGVAHSVAFADELEGPVSANNYVTDSSLDVLGQTIHIDAETVFESKLAGVLTIADIAVGQVVEVSGFSDTKGSVYASRVEVKRAGHEAGEEIEVKGVVSAHDAATQTFSIGRLSVDYSSANLDGLSSVMDGQYVEVKSYQALVDGVMIAREVELEDERDMDDHADEGDEREFEGVVTALGDDGELAVNGQRLYYDQDTEFENGSVHSLQEGVKLKVEAEYDDDGRLYAHELKYRARSDAKLEGAIEAIDTESGSVDVMGQSIFLDNSTMMKDERDDDDQVPVRYFGLDDLALGDWVEVHSYRDAASGKWIATKFERDDEEHDSRYELEGKIEVDDNDDSLSIHGIALDQSVLDDWGIADNLMVEVEGYYNNGVFVVSEIEFEDDDD